MTNISLLSKAHRHALSEPDGVPSHDNSSPDTVFDTIGERDRMLEMCFHLGSENVFIRLELRATERNGRESYSID